MPSVIQVPAEAQASPHFDATAATNAYLAQIPPDKTARSDAYFEGGYWMILWDFLYGVVVALLLLNLRWSARMRDLSERVTRFKPVHTFVYWLQYLILTSILFFPGTVYEDYFREHKYGLATQTFGPWMGDQMKELAVNAVLGGLLAMLLFGVVRRLPRTWWIWGAVVTILFLIFTVLISPVYIVPIFNKVTRLDDPKIVDPILSMARANGIPAKDVYEIDASRQSTRMSANVSGFANTMRITLNDNLLRRGSPEEIQAVMGHEMGHYVMNHVYKLIMSFSIVIVLAFVYLRWSLDWTLQRWGEKWQIRGVGDTAVLPLVLLLVAMPLVPRIPFVVRAPSDARASILRDIVTNHGLELLAMTAMEPPISLDANAIRDEKVKLLRSIRPIKREEVDRFAVRGQYGPGFTGAEAVLTSHPASKQLSVQGCRRMLLGSQRLSA